MPYICQNCGAEGRYGSEQGVDIDTYIWYASQTSVDSCPDCNRYSEKEEDDVEEKS